MACDPPWSTWLTRRSIAARSGGGGETVPAGVRPASKAYFGLGAGAFLALYLPQPLLPDLDRDLHTSPAVSGLVMTAALIGFAFAGLVGEGDPQRTLRRAMWLVVGSSAAAALSPVIGVLLLARLAQGVGVGLLVAGGLADVARRLPPGVAGRVTGALISGTALGGLLARAVGYVGLFAGWRAAMLLGGAAQLAVVWLSLGRLPGAQVAAPPRPGGGRPPLSLLVAGAGILFVSIGMFDLLPYRLLGAPFRLSAAQADLVYLVFILASLSALPAGRAVDRFGPRRVILVTVGLGIGAMLVGLLPSVPATFFAAAGAICGVVGLHVAHSGAAAQYGRSAVGRYLAAYYVGGAVAAPLMAWSYQRFGWSSVILSLCGAWLVVALLALTRQEPDRAQGEALVGHAPPGGPIG